MGLTVHFKLIAPPETDAARARELVVAMRRRAQGFKQRGRVDDVLPLGDDKKSLRWAREFLEVRHPRQVGSFYAFDIQPEEGFIFPVEVGEDCEPLWLGLCHYPKTVEAEGKRYRTKLPGWRFRRCSKTQFASLHGWEHFRRCHVAVVDLVADCRQSGLSVTISDEGEYWPRRSLAALRRNIDEMNGIVAAAAGALKDLDEAANGQSAVQSPIFAHKQFERLEAQGAERVAPVLSRIGAAIRQG